MGDLISRKDMLEQFDNRVEHMVIRTEDDKRISVESFRKFIENQHAVDAVFVTRCEDCMYYKSISNYSGLCRRLKWPTGEDIAIIQTDKDGFCSRGETEEEYNCRMQWEYDMQTSPDMMGNPEDGSL